MNVVQRKWLEVFKKIFFVSLLLFLVFEAIDFYNIKNIENLKEINKKIRESNSLKTKYIQSWDCSDPEGLVVATLAYGKEAKISHLKGNNKKENECSFAYPDNFKVNNTPHSLPVYGVKRNGITSYKREFLNDLLFPEHNPYSVVVVLTTDRKNPLYGKIASKEFTKEGETIEGFLKNDFSLREPLYVVLMYNIPFSQFNEQIGYGNYHIKIRIDVK